ncbi:hypothetical protein WM24_27295 [Burkholderia ubonensis]|uniref:DUF4760 domain-containing protein n=1 Tax=Burkholderia ubonensis TaxID=101571 RepID=UPI000757A4BB|nr:hypothetical protein [Burkholderia ubonensis]KWN79229.1 hypothetical protein WM24_27295 [Burkholderia ubonensis]
MKFLETHIGEHRTIYLSSIAALLLGIVIGTTWSRIPEVFERLVHFAPIGTAVSAIVAVVSLTWQAWRARFNQRIDLILKFAERFEKPEWRSTRSDAARALRADRNTQEPAVSEILSFFEEVGFLFDRGAVDLEAVYEFFEYWLTPYYQATGAYKAWERQDTGCADLYTKLDKLFDALTKLEIRRFGRPPDRDTEDVDKFLEREQELNPSVSAR